MKKVIPKKKDAFQVFDHKNIFKKNPDLSESSSPSSTNSNSSSTMGIAGKTLHTGDLLMVRKKDGLIVPFTGPEGRNDV